MTAKPPVQKSFVVDSMLGKMSKWLRILGFDARYEHLTNPQQIEEYQSNGYLVVTRNQQWWRLAGVIGIHANDPMEQLRELAHQVLLKPEKVRLFGRCVKCNELLTPLFRGDAVGLVPDYVFETQETFRRCCKCGRIFWSGSHPARMLKRLEEVMGWNFQNLEI